MKKFIKKEINQNYSTNYSKPFLLQESDGSKKSLQDIVILTAEDYRDCKSKNLAIDRWMHKILERETKIGITRHDTIPYLPVRIPERQDSQRFLSLAKAVGEIAQTQVIPENHNQMCWLLTLKFFYQAQGICLAHRIFPEVIENPLNEPGILSLYLPETSVKNLKLGAEMDFYCFRLIEKGFSLIKAKAKTENKTFPWSNSTELFLQIEREKFEHGWLSGPMSQSVQWLTKHEVRKVLSAEIRILEHKEWSEKSSKNRKQSKSISLKNLSYLEAKKQYFDELKDWGWSGYWLYVLRDKYLELLKEFQLDKSKLKRLDNKHPFHWLATLWPKYLKTWKNGKEELFIPDLIWIKGNPYQSRSTSQIHRVRAMYDESGYIDWIWDHWPHLEPETLSAVIRLRNLLGLPLVDEKE